MAGTMRQGKNDAWYFEVTSGTDFAGRPIRYNKTFHGTKKQAEKALAAFYTACNSGKVNRAQSLTVSDLSKLYLNEYVTRNLKQSSMRGIRPALNRHILPAFGDKKAAKVTRIDVQQWINSLTDADLSPKTIKNYYSVLSGMMRFAVNMELLDRSPCHDIRLPKTDNKEATYYSRDDVAQLLDAVEPLHGGELRYKVVIYLALFGGLRRGEIAGLNWTDYDKKSHTVHIVRTRAPKRGGGVYEDTPKTEKSRRSVALPVFVCDSMETYHVWQKEQKLVLCDQWQDSPAVIVNNLGAPLYPPLYDKWLKDFIATNDLPPITLHGLRHTHTSLLAYMDVDKMEISKRLGHSQLSTTLNIYTHLFENTDKQIADDLQIFTENLRKTKIKNG